MADTPHVFFTVDRTAYLRNLDREQIHEPTLAIHYQAAPERLDDNRVRMSMRAPILIISQWPEDQQGVADKVADLLNKHWDDDEKPEPSCAACGQPASEHLGKSDCAQFLAPDELAALRKENADLRAQGERQSSTIAIHHQNFDEIYERACRETGEFAEWVRSITHPEADQR